VPKIAKSVGKMAKNGQKWSKINQEQFKLCFTSIIKKILIFPATKVALAYQIIYNKALRYTVLSCMSLADALFLIQSKKV